jgi:hypothetical protein
MSSIDDDAYMALDLSHGLDDTSAVSLSPDTPPTGNTPENKRPGASMFSVLRHLAERRYACMEKMCPGLGCSV